MMGLYWYWVLQENSPSGVFGESPSTYLEAAPGPSIAIILSIISLLTSLTALLGFFSTTVLAWRKEKREERHSELELRKKELEIQKLQY